MILQNKIQDPLFESRWWGADVDAVAAGGRTALMLAAQNGHTSVVTTLLEAGADVKAKDYQGRSALSLATEHAHAEIVQLLRDAGAAD